MIYGQTMDDLYPQVIGSILSRGNESSPRGMRTKEMLAQQVMLVKSRHCLLTNTVRAINFRFAIAEWLWISAGRSDLATLLRYNKEMAKFSDDGVTLTGAYGPRLAPQWDYIVENLQKPDTRQAVTTIWTPSPKTSKDIPCTIALQFLIRNGSLHTIVTMRSSDAWLGLPYDMFNFAMIGNAVAGRCGIEVGGLIMQLGSLHLYEPHWEAGSMIVRGKSESVCAPKLPGFPPADTMLDLAAEGKDEDINKPWDRYVAALLKPTKAEALEVLRAET